MPIDPDSPFAPADPSQGWQIRALPRIIVHPKPPPNAPDPDGIDDWFVPAQAPSTDVQNNPSAPWTPETDASYPDDWIYPDTWNASTPAATPRPAPPSPSSQPNAPNPAISNRPAPLPDPYAAYWSRIPASRLTAPAWAPPVFPSSNPFSPQSAAASPWLTPPPLSPDPLGPVPSSTLAPGPAGYGMLGGIPKMLTEQAAANDPWQIAANGILGGIPKMLAASNDPLSSAGSRGILGALANLQPAPSAAQQAASYFRDARAIISPQTLGFQDDDPLSGVKLVADKKTDKRNLDLFDERAFGTTPPIGSTAPRLVPPIVGKPPPSPPALPAPTPQPPPLSSSPRGSASAPRPLVPNASGTPGSNPETAGAHPKSVQVGTTSAGAGQPAPASGSTVPLRRGKSYEQKNNSLQTTMHVMINGKDVVVRLDFPPNENGVKELKDYNWSSPGYQVPFLQQEVIKDFQAQIRKYQEIHPEVRFQFSLQPPQWIERALDEVGGKYYVEP